jgi:hypothetical protein
MKIRITNITAQGRLYVKCSKVGGAGWQDSFERARKGDPVGCPTKGEKPFLRVARESFYQTTRNDSGKRADKGSFVQNFGSFKPFRAGSGGIWEAWGAEGRNRSSGNGGKKAGFEAVFGIFGQKMRGGFG